VICKPTASCTTCTASTQQIKIKSSRPTYLTIFFDWLTDLLMFVHFTAISKPMNHSSNNNWDKGTKHHFNRWLRPETAKHFPQCRDVQSKLKHLQLALIMTLSLIHIVLRGKQIRVTQLRLYQRKHCWPHTQSCAEAIAFSLSNSHLSAQSVNGNGQRLWKWKNF